MIIEIYLGKKCNFEIVILDYFLLSNNIKLLELLSYDIK